MRPTSPEPGSRNNPLYFRILRDDKDNFDLAKIVVALGLTVLSAYLATQAQRAGSGPDQLKAARMRFHRGVVQLAYAQVKFWDKVAKDARDRYDLARL
jgi:hypothetical protein